MQPYEILNSWLFIAPVSIVLGFLLILICILIYKKSKKWEIGLTLYVFVLVFILRAVVTFKGAIKTDGELLTTGLYWWEKLFDSFIHTLQTFSMDEDYTQYVLEGKQLLEDNNVGNWGIVYGCVASVLNIVAPLLGGAILLDILIGIFPSLKIKVHQFRHKYVFSELNEMSITLAEDIYHNHNYKEINKNCKLKPYIIFTDAYVDDESEESSELFARAKKIGAICLKTDLLELSFARSKTVTYLLIDKNVEDNITSFSKLIFNKRKDEKKKSFFLGKSRNKKHLFPVGTIEKENEKETRVRFFVFVQEEHESDTIHRILNSSDVKEQVTVRAIRDYMNSVINLMAKVPLFLPLIYTPKDELNITIIGSGSIAQEVFKAIYWCGQMKDKKLNIAVLSKDASSMEKRMNEFNKEMMECCIKNSEKLRIYESEMNGPFNHPYLNSKIFKDIEDVTILSSYSDDILKKTDYYVIALGSDALNHKMTSILSQKLSSLKLVSKDGCPETTVIVPAIFDSELAEAIRISRPDPSRFESFIVPFATFKERFSCQNVFFMSFSDDALSTQKLYAQKQSGKCANDEYSWMADVVKEVHAPYKLFGLDLVKRAAGNGRDLYEIDASSSVEVTSKQYYELAWLEHRRWNAFMRSQGFSCPSWKVFESYCKISKNHKNIPLKLHPCLVESSLTPTTGLNITDNCNPSDYEDICYDRLDYASVKIFHTMHLLNDRFSLPPKSGYKAYDYYGYYVEYKEKNERNETVTEWKWDAVDSKLNKVLQPQPNNESSWTYP